MNRAVKFNYLFIGVIGGMLAMWACGDDGSGSGGSKANAQGQPSSCKQWVVKDYDTESFQAPTIGAGEEPFALAVGTSAHLYTRKCVED